LDPSGDTWRQLAQARLAAATQTQLIQTQALAQQQAALRKQRENELATARVQLAKQQQQLDTIRQTQVQKDKQAYSRAMTEGQDLLAKKNYDGAAAAFLVAQRLNKTPVVDNLLDLTAKNRALGQTKNDAERQQLEAKLDAERARRVAADALAKRNQDLYVQALQTAQAALAKKDYVVAQAKFDEAGKVYKTDAVAAGLKQIAQARAQDNAPLKSQQLAQEKAARVKQLLAAGNAQLSDKEYVAAVKTFQQAKQIAPDHLDVLAGLSQAEHARDLLAKSAPPAVAPTDNQKRLAGFQAAMLAAQKAVAAKDYATAVKAYTEATQIIPEDTKALLLLKQTQQAWNDAKLGSTGTAKQQADFAAALKVGQGALSNKKYDDAVKAFTEASKIIPNDAQALKLLKQAQQGQIDARLQAEDAARLKLEQQKKTNYSALMNDATAKLNGKQFADAKLQFQAALKLYPTDPTALSGFKAATQALEPKTPPKDNKALYQKAMLDGSTQEKQQKFADAVKSYETALDLLPKDLQASTGLRRAQLGLHKADGQRYLDTARWTDAQREFEAALQISPTDATAKQLLEKAKKKMK
jgi:tetratricopeptide (TPR) repeat protein